MANSVTRKAVNHFGNGQEQEMQGHARPIEISFQRLAHEDRAVPLLLLLLPSPLKYFLCPLVWKLAPDSKFESRMGESDQLNIAHVAVSLL